MEGREGGLVTWCRTVKGQYSLPTVCELGPCLEIPHLFHKINSSSCFSFSYLGGIQLAVAIEEIF